MLSIAVIGMGQFGEQLAGTLAQLGHEVLAIDSDLQRVEDMKDVVARAARADGAREDTLRALGVQECKVALVALGESDFESAVLAVAALSRLKVPHIIARSSTSQRGRILSMVGAHRVVYPELQMAEQVAREVGSKGLSTQVNLPSGHVLAEVRVPTRLFGLTVKSANVRADTGLNVLGLRRKVRDGEGHGEPQEVTPEVTFAPGDLLVVAGDRATVQAFSRAE